MLGACNADSVQDQDKKNKLRDSISVIMPAHNEGPHLYDNLKETIKTFEEAKYDYEIILVNDGSVDNTLAEANRVAREFKRIKVVTSGVNNGKGHAIKEGFQHADGQQIVFLDADLDLHPEQIKDLLKVMKEQKAEVVIGSKWHPQSKLKYPFMRKVISNIYALILWTLFRLPLRDTQTGLKIFKHEVLKKVFPKIVCKRYAFDVEILANAHHLGYKTVEVPVILHFRRDQRWGRITFKDMWNTGMDTLAIFYRMYILKYYDKHQ